MSACLRACVRVRVRWCACVRACASACACVRALERKRVRARARWCSLLRRAVAVAEDLAAPAGGALVKHGPLVKPLVK